MDSLLTERQAARILNCSVQLLRKWRGKNQGPRRVRLGRCVRYSPDDLRVFIAANGGAIVGQPQREDRINLNTCSRTEAL